MKLKYLHVFYLNYYAITVFHCAIISLIVGHSYNGGVS